MESVEYDLDTSGGLMPQIQQLIAPPALNDDFLIHKKDRRYRRPGRTVNHDNCDSCKEGGDLICCDRCPAAFHLQCHDPPLTDDDLPSGEWLCHRCKSAPKPEEKQILVCEVQLPKVVPEYPIYDSDEDVHMEDVGDDSHSETSSKECPLNNTAFCKLSDAVAVLNPNQYELPGETLYTTTIPGCGRKIKNKEINRMGKKIAHELDNGLVPLPARLCFQCRMSCHVAVLVQCDFCPVLYHSDCLDPPMTALPSGKWMCPNHAAHTVDKRLLKTASYSERVNLYDLYSGDVTPGGLFLSFVSKSFKVAPPFRYKRKAKHRLKAKIPTPIVEHYNNPARLLPSARSIPYCSGKTPCIKLSRSLFEEEEWLISVISFQGEVARFLATSKTRRTCYDADDDVKCVFSTSKEVVVNSRPNIADLPCSEKTPFASQNGPIVDNGIVNGDLGSPEEQNFSFKTESVAGSGVKLPERNAVISSEGFPSASEQLKSMVIPNRTAVNSSRPNSVAHIMRTPLNNCGVGLHPNHAPAVSNSLSQAHVISSQSANPLTQKSESSNNENSCIMQDKITSTSSTKLDPCSMFSFNGGNMLQLAMDEIGEFDKLDMKLVQALAYQRLQQLNPVKCTSKLNKENFLTPSAPVVRARAVVLPYIGKGTSVSMCFRTLNIGVGADMDVCLANYGHCNFVSPKHACIFYDEVTKHYELLNYSEHGTVVDSVLYSCDLSQKPKPSISPNSLSHSMRKLARSTPRLADLPLLPATSDKPTMSSRVRENRKSCGCQIEGPHNVSRSDSGWEGTAILHHGSSIKCGCLQFVFSIMDYGSRPQNLDDSKSDELTCTASSNTSTASSSNTSLLED